MRRKTSRRRKRWMGGEVEEEGRKQMTKRNYRS